MGNYFFKTNKQKTSSEIYSTSWEDGGVPKTGKLEDQVRQTSLRSDVDVSDPAWRSEARDYVLVFLSGFTGLCAQSARQRVLTTEPPLQICAELTNSVCLSVYEGGYRVCSHRVPSSSAARPVWFGRT